MNIYCFRLEVEINDPDHFQLPGGKSVLGKTDFSVTPGFPAQKKSI